MKYYHEPITDWWKRARDGAFELCLAHFPADAARELKGLLQADSLSVEKWTGEDIRLIIFDSDSSSSCCKTLALHDCVVEGTTLLEGEFFEIELRWYELYPEDSRFTLACLGYSGKDQLKLTFSGLTLDTRLYQAMDVPFGAHPWSYLAGISDELLLKHHFAEKPLNEKECALLNLARFLRTICAFNAEYAPDLIPADPKALNAGAEEFLQLAGEQPTQKLEKLTKKLLKKGEKPKLTDSKLAEQLCLPQYEALWRRLYERFAQSQAEYSHRYEECGKEAIEARRRQITAALHAQGYQGTYPDFRKEGVMKGIHFLISYDQSYLVGMEKEMSCFIHCHEYREEDWQTELIYGRAFHNRHTKKLLPVRDVFSCMWRCRGQRSFRVSETFDYLSALHEPAEIPFTPTQFAELIAAKAEFRKRPKEKPSAGAWLRKALNFLFIFLFTGVGFGLLMTLCFMLLSAVIAFAFLHSFSAVWEILREMPWLLLFFIAGVGFGLPMAIAAALGDEN